MRHLRINQLVAIMLTLLGSRCQAADGHVTALTLDQKSQPLTANRIGQLVYETQVVHESKFANIEHLQFSSRRQWLAVAGGDVAESGGVEILAWPSRKLRHRVEPHTDVVWQVAWSSDGSQVVTASQDGTCCVIDAESGKPLRTFIGHSRAVTAITFVDERIAVSGGLDNTLRVWDTNSGQTIRSLSNHTNAIRDLALRPKFDGLPMLVSAGGDRTVRLWQPTIGRMVRFIRLDSAPLCVCWSADGEKIFAACEDGTVQELAPDTMTILASHVSASGRAWNISASQDGKSLFLAGERGLTKAIELGAKPAE